MWKAVKVNRRERAVEFPGRTFVHFAKVDIELKSSAISGVLFCLPESSKRSWTSSK